MGEIFVLQQQDGLSPAPCAIFSTGLIKLLIISVGKYWLGLVYFPFYSFFSSRAFAGWKNRISRVVNLIKREREGRCSRGRKGWGRAELILFDLSSSSCNYVASTVYKHVLKRVHGCVCVCVQGSGVRRRVTYSNQQGRRSGELTSCRWLPRRHCLGTKRRQEKAVTRRHFTAH